MKWEPGRILLTKEWEPGHVSPSHPLIGLVGCLFWLVLCFFFRFAFLHLQDLSIVDSWVYLRPQAIRYKDCRYRYDERSNGPKKILRTWQCRYTHGYGRWLRSAVLLWLERTDFGNFGSWLLDLRLLWPECHSKHCYSWIRAFLRCLWTQRFMWPSVCCSQSVSAWPWVQTTAWDHCHLQGSRAAEPVFSKWVEILAMAIRLED